MYFLSVLEIIGITVGLCERVVNETQQAGLKVSITRDHVIPEMLIMKSRE